MDMVQIKIKGIVATGRYGTLESGDILRTDVEFAKHLVEECGAAEYLDAVNPEAAKANPPAQASKQATKPAAKKKAK